MDRIQVLLVNTGPRWALIGLITIGLILIGFSFPLISSWISADEPSVTLTFINGEVEVSEGKTGIAASTGPLVTRNVRTSLRTGNGTAGLQLPDGSTVIIDSASTIEFMPKNKIDPFHTAAFNLVKGRVLMVSESTSETPTEILLGGTEIIQVFQAAVGLEAFNAGEVRGRVDCLEGECLVNGVYQLMSGQRAQIEQKNIVQVTNGIPINSWISLSRVNGTSPDLLNRFERILAALANIVYPTRTPNAASQMIPITGRQFPSSTAGLTSTQWLTGTATPAQSFFLFGRILPSPTFSDKNDPPSIATFTPVWTQTPSRTTTPTLIPSKTLTPSATLSPTVTSTPTQTYTATITPTPTLIPTATITPTPKPTNTPKPSPTPKPTHTPRNIPTSTPTLMPSDTPTIMPTWTPTNTLEPLPTATFTDTPIP